MSALSAVRDGAISVVANPIFLTVPLRIQTGAEAIFEVLEKDASRLKTLIGKRQLYILDGESFWGELKALERCQNAIWTRPELRDRPTLRGVFSIIGEATGVN